MANANSFGCIFENKNLITNKGAQGAGNVRILQYLE
jgi:hypothetical protein